MCTNSMKYCASRELVSAEESLHHRQHAVLWPERVQRSKVESHEKLLDSINTKPVALLRGNIQEIGRKR